MLSIQIFSRRTNRYGRLCNNYDYLQVLVNNAITWQTSCVIANDARKQQKLFVQGYNLEVHDVRENIVPQNVGAHVIIMLVYRRLLTTSLHGKAAV